MWKSLTRTAWRGFLRRSGLRLFITQVWAWGAKLFPLPQLTQPEPDPVSDELIGNPGALVDP